MPRLNGGGGEKDFFPQQKKQVQEKEIVQVKVSIFLTANEIDFFYLWGKILPEPTTKKCAKRVKRKVHRKASAAKTGSIAQSPGKGGPVTCRKTAQAR